MHRSKTPKGPAHAHVTPKAKSNTPHSKNKGRQTKVSNLRIRIPNGTPEPTACSMCAIARKSRKSRKTRKALK